MSSPSPLTLQRLRDLDRSSSDFHDQISNVLYGQGYQQCPPDLHGDDVVWLIDYLDEALDHLHPSSSAFRKCLRELRSVCSMRGILPTSYTLSSDVLNVGSDPFASGGYGDVYDGTLGGSRVCVKRVRVYTKDDPKKAAKAFCQEAVMWKRLTHPNILPLLGVTIAPLQLISNWMSGGDLPEYIEKHSNADLLVLLSDVAKGLCYLHSCNVIHGDLKGPNILVDGSGHARIADFGLATVTQNLDSMRTPSCHHGHTARWAAPEVLNEGTYSKEADTFSFAMVMIEVFTGAIPFSGGSSVMAMLAIMQGRRPPRPTHPTFTENLWALVQRCWDPDPHSRPEVSEALRVLLTSEHPAWKRLMSHTIATHERISLATTIFSDHNQVKTVGQLSGDDAQNFIDVIDDILDDLAPEIRRECLHYLRGICGRQALVPRSLAIPLCYDPTENPILHGSLSDVWKGRYRGREVAAKVLRISPKENFKPIKRDFCEGVVTWKVLHHPNVLPLLGVTMAETRFVMVSEWMENGDITEFVGRHANANRMELLSGVARGLIYMHDQRIVHGALKGINILIDNNGHACLANFNPLMVSWDQSAITFPAMGSGTLQWMSPELFDPIRFGLRNNCPTKESDYYALGMVVYEVLSGRTPFSQHYPSALIIRILDGERPPRPQGEEGKLFSDRIWRVLELCWEPQPGDRIDARAVLLGLEESPSLSGPPSDADAIDETDTDDQSYTTASDSSSLFAHSDNGLPVLPQGSPHGVTNPTIPQDNGQLNDPPQTDDTKEGQIDDRLARRPRKIFEATIRKLHGL